MRRAILISSLLTVTAIALGGIVISQARAIEPGVEVTALSKQIGQAYINTDKAFLDRALADDWVSMTPGGFKRDKATELDELEARTFRIYEIKDTNVSARVYGDMAILVGERQIELRYKPQEYSGPLLFTEVFVRREGKWRCVSTHQSWTSESLISNGP